MNPPEHYEFLEKPQPQEHSEETQPALPLKTTIETEGDIQSNVYIDDLITICLDNKEGIRNYKIGYAACLWALQLIFKSNKHFKDTNREHVLSIRKLLAEGRYEEEKIFLE